MQAQHDQKWQTFKERRESANRVDQKLKDKCLELREWHGKQFQVLMRQQETISMAREDVIAREARMAERKALLDAREQDISSRQEKLEATLRAKDDDLEALKKKRTKELEDKHKAVLDMLSTDFYAQLKKIADDLAAVSIAKADLDQQVAKLTEELARMLLLELALFLPLKSKG